MVHTIGGLLDRRIAKDFLLSNLRPEPYPGYRIPTHTVLAVKIAQAVSSRFVETTIDIIFTAA
jgi:hypothetical protein